MDNHYNCIYMYTNKINGKKYVGQTTDFNRRCKQRMNDTFNNNKSDYYFPIHNAIRKYGIDNFEITILKENLKTQCLMNLYECYYIEKYNTLSKNGNGYNIADGGSNGFTLAGKTDEEINEWKNKLSEYRTGTTLSEETKEKIRNAQIGEKNHFYGKHHTEETIRKLSEINKGLHNGEKNYMYGRKHTEEALKKMSVNHSKDKVVAINKKDGTIYIKNNCVKMSEFLTELLNEKCFYRNIYRCCECSHDEEEFYRKNKRRYRTYKGFKFYYYNDYINLKD